MTEQQIMKLITEQALSASHVTYDDLVRIYAGHIARIAESISYRDFVGLLAATALLYQKGHEGSVSLDGVDILDADHHAG